MIPEEITCLFKTIYSKVFIVKVKENSKGLPGSLKMFFMLLVMNVIGFFFFLGHSPAQDKVLQAFVLCVKAQVLD